VAEAKQFGALDVDRSGLEKSCTRSPNLGRIKGGGGATSATARLSITGNDGRFALQPQARNASFMTTGQGKATAAVDLI
jgi:hypothetical protein